MTVGRILLASMLPALAGCSILVDIPEVPEGQQEGDARRREILLHADLSAAIVDMPVPIVLRNEPDIAARVTFENVRFTDESDEPVPYEVELVDPATGSLHAWVRLPIVNADVTKLHVYYGGPPLDAPVPSAVWPELYAGAWHLSSQPPSYTDSTSSGNVMELATASEPDPTEGIVGNAILFDGLADHRLQIADSGGDLLDFGVESFGFSLWVLVDSSIGTADVPLAKGNLDTEPGYGFELGTGDWVGVISDGSSRLPLQLGTETDFRGQWVLLGVAVNRDSNFACGYFQTAEGDCAALASFGPVSSNASLEIGRSYTGRVDEIRVYRSTIPRGALALEYQARTKLDFYELGPPEVP